MVVVVDPATVQVVQCLNKHRANVVVVDWVTSDTDRLKLASGDAAGQIVSWDLHAGEHLRQVHDGNLPVHQLRWVSSSSQPLGVVGHGGRHQGLEEVLRRLHPWL